MLFTFDSLLLGRAQHIGLSTFFVWIFKHHIKVWPQFWFPFLFIFGPYFRHFNSLFQGFYYSNRIYVPRRSQQFWLPFVFGLKSFSSLIHMKHQFCIYQHICSIFCYAFYLILLELIQDLQQPSIYMPIFDNFFVFLNNFQHFNPRF